MKLPTAMLLVLGSLARCGEPQQHYKHEHEQGDPMQRYKPQTENPYPNFSLRGNLGRSFLFDVGIAGNTNFNVLAECETESGLAQPITVTLTLGSQSDNVLVETVIEFGNGGLTTKSTIDFENGVSFPVPASWIRVKSRLLATGTAATARLGAFCTNLPIAHAQPLFTTPTVKLPAGLGALATVTVPAFAKDVQITTFPNASDFIIKERDFTGSDLTEIVKTPGAIMPVLRLGTETRDLEFENNAAVATTIHPIFGIYF